jgi:hypothetical protein
VATEWTEWQLPATQTGQWHTARRVNAGGSCSPQLAAATREWPISLARIRQDSPPDFHTSATSHSRVTQHLSDLTQLIAVWRALHLTIVITVTLSILCSDNPTSRRRCIVTALALSRPIYIFTTILHTLSNGRAPRPHCSIYILYSIYMLPMLRSGHSLVVYFHVRLP